VAGLSHQVNVASSNHWAGKAGPEPTPILRGISIRTGPAWPGPHSLEETPNQLADASNNYAVVFMHVFVAISPLQSHKFFFSSHLPKLKLPNLLSYGPPASYVIDEGGGPCRNIKKSCSDYQLARLLGEPCGAPVTQILKERLTDYVHKLKIQIRSNNAFFS
jgi:hypothetical protein